MVLSGGRLPLITFARGGTVRQQPIGSRSQYVSDVRAAVAGARLILGWATYSRTGKAQIYHLAKRRLARP